jgi:DNA-binding CsgD family transcriptional regulator
MTGHLRALGVDEDAERLYRQVLRDPPAALEAHTSALGWLPGEGRPAYRKLVEAGLVALSSSGSLVPESPEVAIGRLVERESARLESRRRQLDDVQAVIVDLANERQSPPPGSEVVALEVVPRDRTPGALESAIRATTGEIRHVLMSTTTRPATDNALVRWAQGQVARGRSLRTLYPATLVGSGSMHDQVWLRNWADVGEQQRMLDDVPHPFTVFGDELVLTCTQWGEITDDLVAIRSPMLIAAFCAIFDSSWREGLPVPHSIVRDVGNERLIAMLAAGHKDEAIARYLGMSLRTVRRRVSLLMEEYGAQTRFQLGIAAERRGLVASRR